MAREDRSADRDSMRHPDQKESHLASTREDSTLAEQVIDDSPHPDVKLGKTRFREETERGRS